MVKHLLISPNNILSNIFCSEYTVVRIIINVSLYTVLCFNKQVNNLKPVSSWSQKCYGVVFIRNKQFATVRNQCNWFPKVWIFWRHDF